MTRVLLLFHTKTKRSARKYLQMARKCKNRKYFLLRKFPVIWYTILHAAVLTNHNSWVSVSLTNIKNELIIMQVKFVMCYA